MTERVEKWIAMVDYDLDTAKAMYQTQRWLYVAFMCHQSIEKVLKGYWCATHDDDPPYTHNIVRLSELCGLTELLTHNQLHFLYEMMPMNIEARYADYKAKIFQSLTPEYCQEILSQTEILVSWIKSKL